MKLAPLLGMLMAIVMGSADAKNCTVNGGAIAFGVYNAASGAALDTIGSAEIDCDENTNVVLRLSRGNWSGSSYAGGRGMALNGGTGWLIYNLYTDAARTHVFGDGSGQSTTVNVQVKKNANYSQTVYGRIPGGQRAALAGSYADVVMLTVSY
jgi:spore coat protein U-like protein